MLSNNSSSRRALGIASVYTPTDGPPSHAHIRFSFLFLSLPPARRHQRYGTRGFRAAVAAEAPAMAGAYLRDACALLLTTYMGMGMAFSSCTSAARNPTHTR